ncbi:hypothetical protein [Aureibacter tunicatorum]|uniref:Uncharacterized protein n=1 Tax=Aureibacter tunicatorum TaxID=866807 RepID=A0AAE3XTQ7_9BACT|nr:hypothetical protein [Aureibacter tunicatorum]MDR6241814.1 hypothetical protein [Aureibacter tunicatorum]BDD07061.1 hypothetical protein AUTU_45440 [Aureibacter tunicatorum]
MNSLAIKLNNESCDQVEIQFRNADEFDFSESDNSFIWSFTGNKLPFYAEFISSKQSTYVLLEPLNREGSDQICFNYLKMFDFLMKHFKLEITCWLVNYDIEDESIVIVIDSLIDKSQLKFDFIADYKIYR